MARLRPGEAGESGLPMGPAGTAGLAASSHAACLSRPRSRAPISGGGMRMRWAYAGSTRPSLFQALAIKGLWSVPVRAWRQTDGSLQRGLYESAQAAGTNTADGAHTADAHCPQSWRPKPEMQARAGQVFPRPLSSCVDGRAIPGSSRGRPSTCLCPDPLFV